MLRLEGLCCGYGAMRAVEGLDLAVSAGSVTALLGANGAGKSSTIMCIAGHVAIQAGAIFLDGDAIGAFSPMDRVAAGIGLVPEGRRLFGSLSVRENLIVGGYCRSRSTERENLARILDIFPRLGERLEQRAGSLSGGEQQMLAIGRALMSRPRLLLIDELSLGLMPQAIDTCYQVIESLKAEGMAILLVEQSTRRALAVADRVSVLESGRPVWSGSADRASQSTEMIDALLGFDVAAGG